MAVLVWLFQASILAGLVRFALSVVGVGVVTYVGSDLILAQLFSYASSAFAVGGDVTGLLSLFGVDDAINLVLSGCSIRLSLMALKAFRVL